MNIKETDDSDRRSFISKIFFGLFGSFLLLPFMGLNRVQADTTTSANGDVIAGNGKTYKIVACVLRNDGTGWKQIGGAHAPINVVSVTSDYKYVKVNFNFTAKNVVSFIAAPDEAMAGNGINFGASVGLNTASIEIVRQQTIGGYFYYDESTSTWKKSGTNNGFITAIFNNGIITITHPPIEGIIASVSCRNGVYIASVGTLGSTTTEIVVRDYNGNLVTKPNGNMRFYFSRSVSGGLNPSTVVDAGGNIWCYGIFEV